MLSSSPPNVWVANLNPAFIENFVRLILFSSAFIMEWHESFQLEIVWVLIDVGIFMDARHNDEDQLTFSNGVGLSLNG